MFLWIMTILVGAAAACFFVDAVRPGSWTSRGLFLWALAVFCTMLNQAM